MLIEALDQVRKKLIDREKMPVLPFRKSRGHSGFLSLSSIGKERMSLPS
jgi:hypothetical protein